MPATSVADSVREGSVEEGSVGEKQVGWIDQLYLAPGFVGKGTGTQLLQFTLSSLLRPVRSWTFQENAKAIRFYENHGFRAIKRTNREDNEEQCPGILYELK